MTVKMHRVTHLYSMIRLIRTLMGGKCINTLSIELFEIVMMMSIVELKGMWSVEFAIQPSELFPKRIGTFASEYGYLSTTHSTMPV